MRRVELIAAVEHVYNALNDSSIFKLFLDNAKEKISGVDAFQSLQKFYASYLKFGQNEIIILKLFKLERMVSPNFWHAFGSNSVEEGASHFSDGLRMIRMYLVPMVNLLKQESAPKQERFFSVVARSQPKIENLKNTITVILPESEKELSNPQRLVSILDSINSLYNIVADLEGHDSHDLSVLSIDSGSDKSFDFLGAAKVIDALKELILGLYDRIVFYKEKKSAEKLDLICKSLPLIEQINILKESGKISPEQAAIYYKQISFSVAGFINSGAILPEFKERSTTNPRLVMAPEPKLLIMKEEVINTTPSIQAEKKIAKKPAPKKRGTRR